MDERKIWTDMRISMNLKKKRGFWTNGRLQKKTKQNKTKKKKLSPDLSESLTRFTTRPTRPTHNFLKFTKIYLNLTVGKKKFGRATFFYQVLYID